MAKIPGIKDYIKGLRNDIPSSIVVFLIALPLCLGIAHASNAPLFSGLIAGIIGGVVVGLASKSHLSVSGPAAGLTIIVATAISALPSFEAFLVAVVLCGILQLIFGFIKAGVIGDYVPNSVIKGMLAAIGLLLILKEFPHLIGYDKDFQGDESFQQSNNENTFSGIFNAFSYITPLAAVIGIVSLVFCFMWDKLISGKKGIMKLVPAPLIAVFLGVAINYAASVFFPSYTLSSEHLVSVPVASSGSEFFSFFTSPDFSYLLNPNVLVAAVTLALVASLESLLSVEAVDELDPYKRVTPTNRELKAQGLGNIISGLIGGLPVTSVIVRSSVNVDAGARTKMSTIYQGILLFACIAFIPVVLNMIPAASLAAILLYTGYKLAKPSVFRAFYLKGKAQFAPFIVTVVAILLTDLLRGVIVGIVVGFYFVVRSNFKTAIFTVVDENNYLFRLRKDVSFLNKAIIKQMLEKVPSNAQVLIDASRADFIDKDVIDTIEDFMLHAPLKNIHVELKKSRHRDQGFSGILDLDVPSEKKLSMAMENKLVTV